MKNEDPIADKSQMSVDVSVFLTRGKGALDVDVGIRSELGLYTDWGPVQDALCPPTPTCQLRFQPPHNPQWKSIISHGCIVIESFKTLKTSTKVYPVSIRGLTCTALKRRAGLRPAVGTEPHSLLGLWGGVL